MSMYFERVTIYIKKKNDFEKGAIFNKEVFKQYESDNIESAREDVKRSKKEDGTEHINFFVSHKHEDLSIYPHTADGTKISNDIKDLYVDYYVRIPKKDNTFTIITLEDWFKYSFKEQEEN